MKIEFKKPTYTVVGFETNYGPWMYHSYADRTDMIVTKEKVLYCYEMRGSNTVIADESMHRYYHHGIPKPKGTFNNTGTLFIATDKYRYSTKVRDGQFKNEWLMSTTNSFFETLALGNMREDKTHWLKRSRHGARRRYWTDSLFFDRDIQVNEIKKWGVKKLLERIGNQPIMVIDEDVGVCDKIKKVTERSKDGEVKDIPVEERYDEDRIVRSNH